MDFEIFQNSNNTKNNLVNNQKKTAPAAQNMNQTSVFENKPPTVVVFDVYGDIVMPIDPFDNTPDMSHAKTAESYIKLECPTVNIEKRGKLTPTTETEKQAAAKRFKELLEKGSEEEKLLFGEPIKKILENPNTIIDFDMKKELDNLIESTNNGKKIDAVNLSLSDSVKIKDLAKVTGLPLTAENLAQYKDKIREWIKNSNLPEIQKQNGILESLEKITDKGIPINVAGGNDGADSVNLFSFARGTTTVGALDPDGKTKTQYSADNSLVNRWEIGNYPVIKTKNKKGETGYDINGDNKPEILELATSGKQKSVFDSGNPQIIKGTSFSTPRAIGKDLRAKFGNVCGQ